MSSTTPGSACIWQVTNDNSVSLLARSRTCLQWTDRSDRDAGRPAGPSVCAFVKLKHQPAQCTRSACALSEPEPEPVVSGCSHIARRICWQSDHTHAVSQSTIDSLDDLSFVKGEAGLSLQPMHVKTMDYWNMLGLVQFAKNVEKRHCSTFVFIWQTLSNYRVTRLKRFISRFTDELCK